jgi:hypothetical protein
MGALSLWREGRFHARPAKKNKVTDAVFQRGSDVLHFVG